MRVRIDRTRCCGNLECMAIAPEVFAADDDGLGVVLKPLPEPKDEASARTAAQCCPAGAIEIQEETS
jgi:ferredoxin